MSDILVVTSTEMQNNFGKYLDYVIEGKQIIITKNGKEVSRMISKDKGTEYLTDSLRGIIKGNYDLEEEKRKALKEKYENNDRH